MAICFIQYDEHGRAATVVNVTKRTIRRIFRDADGRVTEVLHQQISEDGPPTKVTLDADGKIAELSGERPTAILVPDRDNRGTLKGIYVHGGKSSRYLELERDRSRSAVSRLIHVSPAKRATLEQIDVVKVKGGPGRYKVVAVRSENEPDYTRNGLGWGAVLPGAAAPPLPSLLE